jgi:AMP nucleosidase
MGITFINIGVGPSNAKNITDHLAVLRPHCWLMVGHCAGLRQTQVLGDYVLAHGYVRDDNVLDLDLPQWVPVPPIAEVQVALQEAVQIVSHQKDRDVKHSMRTGTVISTDDRNWELRTKQLYEEFRQSRAIALLCVSDKPIHGELKLRGMANKFYRDRVTQHLHVGLETMRILRENGVDYLHSRKLRGFDEPPFR